MSLLVSTGFKTALLKYFPQIFNFGAIFVYGGSRPLTSDDMPGTDPIGMITNQGLPWAPNNVGYGLMFLTSGPYVLGDPSQSWQLMPNANALLRDAKWWRLVAMNDSGLPDVGALRIDGDIGLKASPDPVIQPEILLDTLSLTPGSAVPITTFFYTIPPLPEV